MGGTTTDIGVVLDEALTSNMHGHIEGEDDNLLRGPCRCCENFGPVNCAGRIQGMAQAPLDSRKLPGAIPVQRLKAWLKEGASA